MGRIPVPTFRRATLVVALTGALAAPLPAEQVSESDADAFQRRVAATWSSRDIGSWLALWDFADAEARSVEEQHAREAFAADETAFELPRLARPSAGRLTMTGQVFTRAEPRASLAMARLQAERREGRYVLVARHDENLMDGLVHLSLGGPAWSVRGVSLRLEDFELRMEYGTLYSSVETLGPTALVFVGRGRVRMSPRPRAEREQLRRFSGSPVLDVPVDWSYVRLHPGDFHRVLEAAGLQPEPRPELRRARAEEIFRDRAERSFVLDAALPGSPWWLLPNYGDAVVDFPWRRGRVLTLAISVAEREDVNLFDRDRRVQVCMYASSQQRLSWEPDGRRSAQVLDQELAVRFEPERLELSGAQVLRLRPLGGSMLRLRLDDDFRVASVTTADGTSLPFFRVRGQGTLVVALGSIAQSAETSLVIRYSGRHDPAPIDHELVQLRRADPRDDFENVIVERPPIVYSNRTAWYPRPPDEEFVPSTVAFDVPDGWLALAGGERRSLLSDGRRTETRFRLAEPGKFLTALVGRFVDLGMRQQGGRSLRGYATGRLRGHGLEQLETAERILDHFERLFGPMPYKALGLAIAEASLPGGHSPPGLVYLQRQPPILLARGLPDDPANFSDMPEFFLAHELAHQWWGQASAPASYRERWLSEAWAQYAAALWVRERYGQASFQRMLERMARWAKRHDAAGPINLGHRLGVIEGDPRIQRAVVYDKGALVLHMLRGLLGDEPFFAGARLFLERHRFAKVGTEDLRRALEEASGRDLRAHFESWIYDTGLPRLVWSWKSDGAARAVRTKVTVRIEAGPRPLPLQVTLETAAGRHHERVLVSHHEESFSFETREPPTRVSINDDRGLLAHVRRGAASGAQR